MEQIKSIEIAHAKNSHFTKFIYSFGINLTPSPKVKIPFRRKKLWEKVVDSFDREQLWEPLSRSNLEYILPHIETFLYENVADDISAKNRYVSAYSIHARELQLRLPPQCHTKLVVKKRDGKTDLYPIHVKNIEIYLFRSGVGMLVFDVALLPPIHLNQGGDNIVAHHIDGKAESKRGISLDDLIDFNYEFRQSLREKELAVDEHESIAVKRYIETRNGKKFTLRHLIKVLLNPVFQVSSSIFEFYDERLLGYSFALLKDQDEQKERMNNPYKYEQLKDYLFWMRNFFRRNYLPPNEETRLENNLHVLATFENIYFGMSMDGGGILVGDTGNPFIRSTFSSRVRKNYFVLFLLVLHQRLATIYFTMQLSDKAINYQFKKLPDKMLLNDLKFLRGQIFEFIIKCWFADVSNMEMYSRVYHRWQEVLRVKALLQSIKSEVEELDDYFQRIQSERETRFMNMLSWLFFPLMILFGFWGMNFIELTQPGFSIFNLKIWLITGVGFGVYYLFVWVIKRFLK